MFQFDACWFGLRPLNWNCADGDVRCQKSSLLVTNNPHLAPLEKHCADAPPHKHEVIIGGPAARHTARYADFFAATYAACLRLSWRNGFQPAKLAYMEKSVEIFTSLLYVPEKAEASNAVHVRAGSASSSGPAEPGARRVDAPAAAVGAAAPAAAAVPAVAALLLYLFLHLPQHRLPQYLLRTTSGRKLRILGLRTMWCQEPACLCQNLWMVLLRLMVILTWISCRRFAILVMPGMGRNTPRRVQKLSLLRTFGRKQELEL